MTAGLAALLARMTDRRADHLRRTTVDAYEWAYRSLHLTVTLDAVIRELASGRPDGRQHDLRDGAMADTVRWILDREDRIVLTAHNGHIQRCPLALPGLPRATTMGMRLAGQLGGDYLVIGTTSATGATLTTDADGFAAGEFFVDMEEPRPGSLDALMAASHDGPFATDLRRLSATDTETLRTISRQRFGGLYADVNPLEAFDLVVHLPHVTPAEPDPAALAHAPREVREAFARWKPA
nr:erythromycin esterase family protein [Streptomyces sp. MST-110588]